MAGRLQDKIAVITGATSGMGLRTAELYADEGATVVISGRREDLGEAAAARIGRGAEFVRCDVTDEAQVKALIEGAAERHGRLDVLFNNAGGPSALGRVQDIDLADLDHAYNVLLRSVFACTKYAAPIMRAQQSGSIINNGSVAGYRAGFSSSMVYSLFKGAVVHFTKLVALELGEDFVRVNSISPGPIATGIFAKIAGVDDQTAEGTVDKIKARLEKATPIPRAGVVDDVAWAAVYLGSDESSYINAQDILVDGGMIWGRRFSESDAGRQAMHEYLRG